MTDTKSELTIPLNATNLITSLVGFVIIAGLAYLWNVPRDLDELADSVKLLNLSVAGVDDTLKTQIRTVTQHEARIQLIENTRFDRNSAIELKNDIVREITSLMKPVQNDVERNTRDIMNIERELKDKKP